MESKKLTEEQFGKIKEAACQVSEQEFTNMVLDCIVEDGGLKSLNPKTDIPMMHKLITQCSYSEFDDLVENGNLPAIKLSAEETELLKAGGYFWDTVNDICFYMGRSYRLFVDTSKITMP